jgi:hypothetical protein
MNIFFLDRDPQIAASLHSDQHVIKMALETAQILCSALHRHGIEARYKPTHLHHPSVLWTGDSLSHWMWTRQLGLCLCAEYTFRWGKTHACQAVIESMPNPPAIPDMGWIDPPQAMPDQYRMEESVLAYRAYYKGEKTVFPGKGPATWTKRARPDFL